MRMHGIIEIAIYVGGARKLPFLMRQAISYPIDFASKQSNQGAFWLRYSSKQV